jgi:hypothetical protein
MIGIGPLCLRLFSLTVSEHECLSRRIWVYPWPYSQIMKEAFHLRSRLVPYLYTQARHTHDSGITFLYPLYYDYPGQFHNDVTPSLYRFLSSLNV